MRKIEIYYDTHLLPLKRYRLITSGPLEATMTLIAATQRTLGQGLRLASNMSGQHQSTYSIFRMKRNNATMLNNSAVRGHHAVGKVHDHSLDKINIIVVQPSVGTSAIDDLSTRRIFNLALLLALLK